MFIVTTTKDKTIPWPVKVEVAAEGGRIAKYEFTGVFKLLDDDERDAQIAAIKANHPEIEDEPDSAWKERSVDGILMSMVDWKQVCDENKAPIAFNRDSLLTAARSMHGLSILRAINTAINEIRAGVLAKN